MYIFRMNYIRAESGDNLPESDTLTKPKNNCSLDYSIDVYLILPTSRLEGFRVGFLKVYIYKKYFLYFSSCQIWFVQNKSLTMIKFHSCVKETKRYFFVLNLFKLF